MSNPTTHTQEEALRELFEQNADLRELEFKLNDPAENPRRLARSRARFDYDPSLSPTPVIASPTNDEQVNFRMDKRARLVARYERSIANNQFRGQVKDAVRTRVKGEDAAAQAVKAEWVKQGIWDSSSWGENRVGDTRWYWAHEARPGDKGQNLQVQSSRFVQAQSASRPSAQFLYQVKEEVRDLHRRYILAMSRGEVRHDIHTKAYEKVRKVWESRGIWHSRIGEYSPGQPGSTSSLVKTG
jgi:hypothetical protein